MNVFMFFGPNQIAETVGFEPTCRLPDNLISSQARYDHFDTAPCKSMQFCEHSI